MPEFVVQTIIEYRIQADSPEDAVRMIEDGETKHHDVIDAWVENVYDNLGITKMWPKDRNPYAESNQES